MAKTIRLLLFAVAALIIAAPAHAGKPRRVEIHYDITKPNHEALEIWVDCTPKTSGSSFDQFTTCDGGTPLTGTNAASFVFSDKDTVTFVLLYQRDDKKKRRGEIVHSITGTGVSDKDIASLKKIVGAAENSVGTMSRTPSSADTAEIQVLTDDFDIGQKIVVTFSIKEATTIDAKEIETTTATRGPFAFRVGGAPRFKLSYGIGFSNAPSPTVAIEKTSTIVEFQKDGKTQQAYQQQIALRDADPKLGVIQALVTQLNVRLGANVYGSVGFQVNEEIFEEPMLGLTYRHQAGSRLGLYVTAGVHFSREIAIREDSGFKPGYRIDPTQPLTVDEIPTETKTRNRFVLALTVDFR